MSARVRHVIVGILDQYALARGNCDIEYAVCKMTSGKQKRFETDDAEFEAFVDDRDAYWKKHGWYLVDREGKLTLTTTP